MTFINRVRALLRDDAELRQLRGDLAEIGARLARLEADAERAALLREATERAGLTEDQRRSAVRDAEQVAEAERAALLRGEDIGHP
ncbi:MAG: hypothetical protein JNM77_08715 [Pseudonocardia sp.]|nr:hypothetical protein [Pseudonocardia sp.]